MTKAIRESSHERMAATVRFPELQDAWVEPGRPVAIQGFTISAGLFYVGDALPFAISPTARVERPSTSSLPCWTWEPRYRSLYPSERGLYLSWLASGRTQPAELAETYWKLFISGLEWRLFIEQQVDVERGLSVAELLYRYGVRGNCVLLVPWLHWWAHLNCPEQHGDVVEWLLEQGCQLFGPYETALVLADLARAGVPLKAELAYAMIRNHPNRHSATTQHYGDPVSKQRFLARFAERFPEGMLIKQTPKTTTVHYFAQCPDLGDLARDAGYKLRLFDEIPDVWTANDDFVEVIRIWNAIVNELVPPSSRMRASVPPKPAGLTLDPEKVKALTDESASIQGILAQRLGNLEEPAHPESQSAHKVNAHGTANAAPSPPGQPALAAAYQAALRDLLQRTQWSRAELEALAKRHRLLPFAFYQAVNEWTMAAWGDFLLDGQEVLHVNQQLLNQIPI